ncbi:hypothetical protein EHQ12_05835 [Leptospira gomenensis]|uniref:Uncharacterized protein n=1 Tax=Leptospira gomenensis TaxID=2484974 RepID=A0A5F1YEJ6_9LEPT|nr:hypothetical protein [Leptospira gomenensis]TGK36062.1 hypothetical protein EHQ17_05660 [Leptospira gomenensis]TGK41808.1 hypothetical protein EHQ12_05835 [Leptospira gomenensis]TGK53335.1 hypothetical protein EHQ07_00070 [Leptospira gomenensis]TGK64941.1 hypothetical protein EHQ13_06315 [Leptospira gomenensis]
MLTESTQYVCIENIQLDRVKALLGGFMRILSVMYGSLKNNPPLFWNGVVNLLVLFVLVPAFFLDSRTVTGAPVWLKPIKFAISISAYSFTLVWILGYVRGNEKYVRGLSWIVTAMLTVENVAIFGQAYRGIPSHFNVTTPLNGAIFSVMGTAIGILWISHMILAAILIFQKTEKKALRESLGWAMIIAGLGMILGFWMTVPRPEQLEAMKAGSFEASGGHTFGAPDAGPGIPILGWSTVAGDMRIPHFIGIHAMQLIPFLAFVFGVLKFTEETSVVAIRIFSVSFLVLVGTLTAQALSGQTLIRPSLPFRIGFMISFLGMMSGILSPVFSSRTNRTRIKGA